MTNEQGRSGQLQLLTEAAAALARSSDLDVAVERLLSLAVDMLGGSLGVVYLQDPDRVELQLGVAVGVARRWAMRSGVPSPRPMTQWPRSPRPDTPHLSGGDVPPVIADAGIATACSGR